MRVVGASSVAFRVKTLPFGRSVFSLCLSLDANIIPGFMRGGLGYHPFWMGLG